MRYNLKLYPKGYRKERMSIAEFVKERRKKLGMTQVVLADRAGVGLRFLRELEQGKTNLRLDKVNQVLQMFGNTVSVGLMDRSVYA